MTQTILNQFSQIQGKNAPKITYRVAMPQPESHLFEVILRVKGYLLPVLDLKMPVWTPGSYLVREYAKHLQDFGVKSGEKKFNWRKIAKNHWQIETDSLEEQTIEISYRIFANELSVRTNHLDATHGYFNGAAIFLRIPGLEKQPIEIEIALPQTNWQITTPLPEVAGQSNTFIAADFDTLVDSPFEMGTQQVYEFEVLGKAHKLAIWGGKSNIAPEKVIADTQKIIELEAKIFSGLPYDRYLFLLHLSTQGNGGLEHKYACSLNYPRFGFRADKYNRFMQLVAHEFFHLWNIKRIRPKALEEFDYDRENYTSSLWFSEGTTSYYDLTIPLRAGIYDTKTFLQNLGKEITRYELTPGRWVQPVSESSLDAWIKLYRPEANSNNAQISYYLKGEMVSLLLDLLIREKHDNQKSLDDVMLKMWQKFGIEEIGFTPQQLQEVMESVAGVDLTNFFLKYIDGTEELPFNEYLEPFGLQVVGEDKDLVPNLGIKVNSENGREVVKFVETGTPAQKAGIDPGDELLAIDGIRVTASTMSEVLQDYQEGDRIEVTVFHQDQLRQYQVLLAPPRPSSYAVKPVSNPTERQQQNFANYSGGNLQKLRE